MELIIWRQTLIIFRHERHWSGTFGNELVHWTTTIAIVTVTCTCILEIYTFGIDNGHLIARKS